MAKWPSGLGAAQRDAAESAERLGPRLSAREQPTLPICAHSGPLRIGVLGQNGFIGGALLGFAVPDDITLVPLSAPRVHTAASTAAELADESTVHHQVVSLTEQLRGLDVLINAAGMANPDANSLEALMGANALLPALVAQAAIKAGVRRVVHLSSAAVQGKAAQLDESARLAPFSAYSYSKALGEQALTLVAKQAEQEARGSGVALDFSAVILRATSVQGLQRKTTANLVKIASSPLASVAGNGLGPSVVSSVDRLVHFTFFAALSPEVPEIILQPWEGSSARQVLQAAGGKDPATLLTPLCRLLLSTGYALSARLGNKFEGPLRRVEMMWFGQGQKPGWADAQGFTPDGKVLTLLERARREQVGRVCTSESS